MKVKQLFISALLVLPLSANAAVFDVSGTFSGSVFSAGPGDVELDGNWSFTFDSEASLSGLALTSLSVTPSGDVNFDVNTFDTTNVFAEINWNTSTDKIANVYIYGAQAGTGMSGGINDLFIQYIFNGSLHNVAYADSDTFNAISATDSGLFTSTEALAAPIPAAAWLFGSGLVGLIGIARRKKAA